MKIQLIFKEFGKVENKTEVGLFGKVEKENQKNQLHLMKNI